ncbi:MAG: hypothetical protein PHO01_04750 [Desulfotomaculaceae bacterium]|nr:hypothetical protein [Desulfotomaculaceae bacterium]
MKKTDKIIEIENALRALPEVRPDRTFQEQLGQTLAKRHAELAKERRSKKNRGNILRFGAVAAGLLIALISTLTFYPVQKPPGYTTGPLFLATAQATGAPGLTFGDNLDSMRLVKFNVQGALPAGEREGTIVKLKKAINTEQDVLEMAAAMGIEEPKVSDKQPRAPDGPEEPETSWVMVSGENGRLSVWLNQGTWLYEQEADSIVKPSQPVSEEAAKDIAVQWLAATGLLPQGEYAVNQTQSPETFFETVIKPAEGPEVTIVGSAPQIRVIVTEQGRVVSATGTWFEQDGSEKVRLAGYEQALEALKRGEGVFEARGYRPFTAGTAEIQKTGAAYQLAYSLDFTPYYVPVAVFEGEFTPEGGTKENFTAFVSLLENNQRENAGNFILDAALPQVESFSSGIAERGNEVARAELPVLARYFGVVGQPDDSGGISGENGKISPSSWNGGWLYRSPLIGVRHCGTPVPDDVAVASANQIVAGIPALPGDLGEPFVRAGAGDDFKYVIYPVIYEGKHVFSTGGPGYESNITVQVGPQGEIWSVQCSKPMVLLEERQPLISPERAWEKLLKNDFQILIEDFFGFIPGNRFAATYSKVTKVELIYKPRHTNMARNENYDLMYMFTGTARIGTKDVRFKAFVNAID